MKTTSRSKSRQAALSRKRQQSRQLEDSQQVVQVTEQIQFSGPIPPPDAPDRYNQVIPGAADRIITMAEQEAGNRHDVERLIIEIGYKEAKAGQICAVALGSLAIVSGAIISVLGAQWAGAIIGGFGVVGLVSVFVSGRKGWRPNR